MKKLDFPIDSCTIDLTEKCNLRCKYCFTYGIGKRDLTIEQGKKTIDWLFKDEVSQNGKVSVNWWGGEPFLRFEQMKALTDYALELSSKTGKTLTIGGTSNTTLINKEAVDWMNKHRSYFMLSIDGLKNIQDFNRPGINNASSWDMLEKQLPYIVEKIPFINSRMSPTIAHIGQMYESFKILNEVHKIKTQMYSPVYEDNWTDDYLAIAEQQLVKIADMVIEKRLKGEQFQVKHLDDGARIIEEKKTVCQFPCGAGRFYVGISTDGVIYPCHRFNKYDGRDWKDKAFIGTIDDGIINSEFRQQFIDFNTTNIPQKCLDCELYGNLCDRPCYAVAYDLTGSIFGIPDVYCRWNKMHAKVVRYFYQKLKENNLPILGMNNGGEKMSKEGNSCVCNNLCYLENTEEEVKFYDPSFDNTCMCYNTNYNGPLDAKIRPLSLKEKEEIKAEALKNQEGVRHSEEVRMSGDGQMLLKRLNDNIQNLEQTNNKLSLAIEKLTQILEQKS